MHTVETIIETAGTTPLSDWPVWICLMILLAIEAVYAAELHIPKRRKKKTLGPPLFLRAASLIQRLGIGYDRTGTVARAIMSCGERNQST